MPQNEKQLRMMHVVNLMSIAYADVEIAEEENNALVSIAKGLGLTKDEFELCINHWKNTAEEDIPLAIPESDDDQIEYLKHFTFVMMSDGTIDDSEKEYLASVADSFGYDPEKVVPMLIDEVYNEFFASDEDEESDGEEEDEDEDFFEDTDIESQLEMGKIYLEEKKVEEAFDELFLPALRNADACSYFMIIPNVDTRLFRLSEEQLEVVNEAAERNYSLAWYILGRYHQVLKPEEDSLQKAHELLEQAAEGGIPDALWALTNLYLYGYMGPVDLKKYNEQLDKAFDEGSMQAFKQKLSNMIHGVNGNKADPKQAIKIIQGFLGKDEEYEAIHPDILSLLGDAYRVVGNKEKADKCYESAMDHGYFEAGALRFRNRVEGPDKDFYRDTMSVLLDFACDDKDPGSFLDRALEHVYHCEKEENPKAKTQWHKKIKEDLETAVELGNGDAAYYIGLYCYTGSYGFEKDPKAAWSWFSKGQDLESGLAYLGTARMIEDGVHPSGMPEGYLDFCIHRAKQRGAGEPSEGAAMPTVFIVNTEGDATIYKLQKEEWYKLAHLIGAKRIAPVRVDALDKIAKSAGFDEHLVAWVDIDAPRKGLPVNSIAASFFPGILAGDVVFSLADNIYDPMPFFGAEDAQNAAKALGAKVKAVVTDLSDISDAKQEPIDYSKVNPYANKGWSARIEPDGKAYLIESSLDVFALFEEDIYDPARLQKLYKVGKDLGLAGRLTMWTENTALRKQLAVYDKYTKNPIGAKYYPGPVADNVYIALEDEDFRITLFNDPEQLRQVCIALGVKPGDVEVQD